MQSSFLQQQLQAQAGEWFRVFDDNVMLAMNAVADLVEDRLRLQPVEAEKVVDLHSMVRTIIEEIKADPGLDDETRRYLLELALYLLQVLHRFDLFGSEGIVDLRGQFLSTVFNFHPELLREDTEGAAAASGRRLFNRLWAATVAANTLTGLVVNADVLGGWVHLALNAGRP